MELSRYSFLLGVLIFILWSGYEAWTIQRGTLPQRMIIWAGLMIAVVSLWYFFLRPTPTAEIESVADVDALIGGGQPVVLELYSPY